MDKTRFNEDNKRRLDGLISSRDGDLQYSMGHSANETSAELIEILDVSKGDDDRNCSITSSEDSESINNVYCRMIRLADGLKNPGQARPFPTRHKPSRPPARD
uniref:Uncharacterized protein n=1 Tax=Romanomermis culicivorax TaxID=13658 RepID=A0A915K5V5_ROMCU